MKAPNHHIKGMHCHGVFVASVGLWHKQLRTCAVEEEPALQSMIYFFYYAYTLLYYEWLYRTVQTLELILLTLATEVIEKQHIDSLYYGSMGSWDGTIVVPFLLV